MEKLIDYTYTGQVLIDIHNVQALVMAADLLSFIKLRYVSHTQTLFFKITLFSFD